MMATRLWRRARRNRRTQDRIRAEPRRSRWARFVWPLALAGFAAAGAAAGIHYGWQAVRESPRLSTSRIVVSGNSRAWTREVIAYAGVRAGDPIFDVDLDRVALGVRRHPWVKSARVERQLPDRLSIRVSEHEPALLVSLGDLYLAGDDGTVFKRLAASDGLVLPVVTGIPRDSVDGSEESATLVRAAVALAAAFARHGAGAGRLEEMHWDTDLGWSMLLRRKSSGALVSLVLGNTPASRIALAVTALKALDGAGMRPAVVWADGVTHPGRVHAAPANPSNTGVSETLIAKAR